MLSRFSQDRPAPGRIRSTAESGRAGRCACAWFIAHASVWDGNKRTAAVAGKTVIVLNGAALSADDPELYGSYIGLADGVIEAPAFADCLRQPLHPRQQERVHPPAADYRRDHGAGSLSRTLLSRTLL
ncbi:hypothetical protein [Xanthomonas euroxanthea]|uniref:hypothetical protein n=1 Tax=Xanthomonas euroxanthea TaxID=2259622 RepID=UPI003CCCF9C1